MPRSNTSFKSSPKVSSSSTSRSNPLPALPAGPARPAGGAPAAIVQQENKSNLGESIKNGFGLGVGSAIGHRIVGGLFGSLSTPVPTLGPHATEIADKKKREFDACMKESFDDYKSCKKYLEHS